MNKLKLLAMFAVIAVALWAFIANAQAITTITHPVVQDVPQGVSGGVFDIEALPGLSDPLPGDIDCDGEIKFLDVVSLFRAVVSRSATPLCPVVNITPNIQTIVFPDYGITDVDIDADNPAKARISFVDGQKLWEPGMGPFTAFTLVLDAPEPVTFAVKVTSALWQDDTGEDLPQVALLEITR